MKLKFNLWQYQAAKKKWVCLNGRDKGEELAKSAVKGSSFGVITISDGYWLVQQIVGNGVVKSIEWGVGDLVRCYRDDIKLDPETEIWYWDGQDLYELFPSANAVDDDKRHVPIMAMLDLEDPENEEVVAVYRGPNRTSYLYDVGKSKWTETQIETIEEPIDLNCPGNENESLWEPEELFRLWFSYQVMRHKSTIVQVEKVLKKNDIQLAAQMVLKIVAEILEGAEPAPVQGHNVGMSIPGQVDTWQALCGLMTGSETLASVNDPNRANFTGQFGGVTGTADAFWSSLGSIVGLYHACKNTKEIFETDSAERSAKFGSNSIPRALLTGGTLMAKIASTTTSAVKALSDIATLGLTVPGTIVPGVSVATGLIATIRSSCQADKSRQRVAKFNRILNIKKEMYSEGIELDREVGNLLGYALGKSSRKFGVKTAEATTAAFASAGGVILVVGAVVAGANAWNPVGWAIGGCVFVAGAGILCYKVGRKVTSKHRAEQRGFSRDEFPRKLLGAFVKWVRSDQESIETHVLKQILHAYGVDPTTIFREQDFQLAEERIARHLKS